jgi:hypothetical protein
VFPTTSRLRLALTLSTVFGLCMLVGCEDSITPLPAVDEISISPASAGLALNATQQYMATTTYSESSTANRTSLVNRVSSGPTVVSVGSTGPATDLVSSANASLGSAKSDVSSVTPPPVPTIAANRMWSWKITPAIALSNAFRIDHLEVGRAGERSPGHPFTNTDWNRSFPVISFDSVLSLRLPWRIVYRDGRVAYSLNRWMSLSASGRNFTHGSQLQTGGPVVGRRLLGTMSFNF